MSKRLFEYIYWQNRNSKIPSNLAVYVGNQLIHGATIPEALSKVSIEIDNINQKKAFKKAATLIKEGNEIGDALYSARVSLKGRDRYILAQKFSDKQKGKILKSWSESKFHATNSINYFIICLILTITCLVFFPNLPFVIPQFREILWGFGCSGNDNFFITFAYNILNPGVLIVITLVLLAAIVLLILLVNYFSKTNKLQEESDFLALLSTLEVESQFLVLESVVNPICFPIIHKELARIVNALKSGENLDICLKNSGLSDLSGWLLNLNMFDKDKSALKDGSIILNEKIMLSTLSSIKIIECFVVLLQSLVYLFLAYVIFGSLNFIIVGSLLNG